MVLFLYVRKFESPAEFEVFACEIHFVVGEQKYTNAFDRWPMAVMSELQPSAPLEPCSSGGTQIDEDASDGALEKSNNDSRFDIFASQCKRRKVAEGAPKEPGKCIVEKMGKELVWKKTTSWKSVRDETDW